MTNDAGGLVMIVDDDPDIRETIEQLLRKRGHPVTTASDGAEALDRLRTETLVPCLILVDLMMPGMNGFQLMQALGADPALAAIPVVVITGAGPAVELRRKEIRGEVMRKPFDLPALLSVVRRHCCAA